MQKSHKIEQLTGKSGEVYGVHFLTDSRTDGFISNYENSLEPDILSAYGRPSQAKMTAEQVIKQEMDDVGGYGYLITGHNSCTFTCAYRVNYGGADYLVYHTAYNRYLMEYPQK